MPTRNEKLAEYRAQRNRLAVIVDQARAACDAAVVSHAQAVVVYPRTKASKLAVAQAWVGARRAMDLLVGIGRAAAKYDQELLGRGVDLSLL